MKAQYDPDLVRQLKKLDVKIRKSFKEQTLLFTKEPHNPKLRNHPLRDKWEGHRSIDITADYRAIYHEIHEGSAIYA